MSPSLRRSLTSLWKFPKRVNYRPDTLTPLCNWSKLYPVGKVPAVLKIKQTRLTQSCGVDDEKASKEIQSLGPLLTAPCPALESLKWCWRPPDLLKFGYVENLKVLQTKVFTRVVEGFRGSTCLGFRTLGCRSNWKDDIAHSWIQVVPNLANQSHSSDSENQIGEVGSWMTPQGKII